MASKTHQMSSVKHNLAAANPAFQPRPDLISGIQLALATRGAVAVVGNGGMGKSQLAKHFAHQCVVDDAAPYSLVWRFEARTSTEVESGYRSLAEVLGISGESTLSLEQLVAAVHVSLAHSSRYDSWLIVFDDPKLESTLLASLSGLLPRRESSGVGHVLITSRSQTWTVCDVVHVTPFSEKEAVAFVTKALSFASTADCMMLCAALGNHPLALSQAVGY